MSLQVLQNKFREHEAEASIVAMSIPLGIGGAVMGALACGGRIVSPASTILTSMTTGAVAAAASLAVFHKQINAPVSLRQLLATGQSTALKAAGPVSAFVGGAVGQVAVTLIGDRLPFAAAMAVSSAAGVITGGGISYVMWHVFNEPN